LRRASRKSATRCYSTTSGAGLSSRDRSLITVASLIALYRSNELKFHLGKALENGVTHHDEIIEMITHLAF
jgi:4-carboxymuconolactone decarboxylase